MNPFLEELLFVTEITFRNKVTFVESFSEGLLCVIGVTCIKFRFFFSNAKVLVLVKLQVTFSNVKGLLLLKLGITFLMIRDYF